MAAKALYHPKLNFILNCSREEDVEALEDTDTSIAGFIRMDFNLFKGGGDSATIRKNARLLTEAKFREAELTMNIKNKVRFEFNTILTSEKQMPLLKKK